MAYQDLPNMKTQRTSPKRHSKSGDQIVEARDIDPVKLADILDKKFGKGNYMAEMRHNQFFIRARDLLTHDEIFKCFY